MCRDGFSAACPNCGRTVTCRDDVASGYCSGCEAELFPEGEAV